MQVQRNVANDQLCLSQRDLCADAVPYVISGDGNYQAVFKIPENDETTGVAGREWPKLSLVQ